MRLHLSRVEDFALYYLDNAYIEAPRPMTIKKTKEKGYNQMMIDLASSLCYVEFDDVKDCTTAKQIWDKLAQIPGETNKC